MLEEIKITTTQKEQVIDITPEVERVVEATDALQAGVFVYVPHSDAAVNIQEFSTSSPPPLNRLLHKVLQDEEFHEPRTGAAFVAPTEVLIAAQGKLLLGEGQRICFYEFNGPKERSVYVLVIPAK